MKASNQMHNQLGVTLVELMIASLIGAFLLGGVIQGFVSSKQTYRVQDNLSRLQENGRFAMYFLTRDIRMAGYWGCLIPVVGDIAATDGGVNANRTLDPPDAITLRGAFSQTITGECFSSVVTTATYYTDASSTISYSVSGNELLRNGVPLIEGIENMQILYGEDTDQNGTVDYFVPGGTAGLNLENVVSIQVSLLVRSNEDNVTSQPIAYSFNDGATTTPADNRVRRVFTSTIAIRNRLP